MSPTASALMNIMENEPEKRHEQIVVEEDSLENESTEEVSKNWERVKR